MISITTRPSPEPLQPGADLVAHLAASPRPAIIHYAEDGRTELSGRVAINWATKMTHLIDSYGIASPDPVLINLPVTWRSLVLTLGVAWCELECTSDAGDAAAILTDQPDDYLREAAELFITHQPEVDAALVDVDDEVLSHPDQALLAVPDIIGNAQTSAQLPHQVDSRRSGIVIRSQDLRLDSAVWWAIVDAWRKSQPVVLVDETDTDHLERIIASERLD